MSANGLPPTSEPRTSELAKPKPKLFSMNQGRPLLEHKRLNTTYSEQSADRLSFTSQKAPRLSLNSFIANNPRASTPVQPRTSILSYGLTRNADGKENENGASSPSSRTSPSPERAYIQQNRRTSASPRSRRVSNLHFSQEPPAMASDSSRATFAYSGDQTKLGDHNTAMLYLNTTAAENQQLSNENYRINTLYTQASDDLAYCRSRLAIVTRQLEEANSELKTVGPALALSRESVVSINTELASSKHLLLEAKAEIVAIREEQRLLSEARIQERTNNERLMKSVENAKAVIAGLRAAYNSLGESFQELKKSHDHSQRHLSEVIKDADETKRLATNGLAALGPMLDDQNTLARAADTKAILKELQEDLVSSHQVTDLLRDKLHHQGSQLADAQCRVRELEEEKRGSLRDLLHARQEEKRHFELLMTLEGRFSELSDCLSVREKETFDTLAGAAAIEVELKAATIETEAYKSAQEMQAKELQALRIIKEENVSKLLALQDVINARDKEIIHLKGEVKAQHESKAELRALLAESKKDLAQKTVDLQARDPNDDLLLKIRDGETEIVALKSTLNELQRQHALLRKSEVDTRTELQEVEKSNAELLGCNKLLKDSLAETKVNVEELKNSASGKCQYLEDELERTRTDAKQAFDRFLGESSELKERLSVQSIDLFQSKEECATLKERLASTTNQLNAAREQRSMLHASLSKQQEDSSLLAVSQEKRASAAEASAALAQAQVADLKARLIALNVELKAASMSPKNSATTQAEQEVIRLGQLVADLEQKNGELAEAANGILKRYEIGLLTDIEKAFIGHLMDEAQRIHEEDAVKKDHELLRRQHMIEALKANVSELKATVARFLKEGQPAAMNKPMAGLNAWLGSSPDKHADGQMEVNTGRHDHEGPPVDRSMPPTSISDSSMKPPAPVKATDPKFSQIHDDADSDDDRPLSSGLSQLSDDAKDERRVGNKRSRSSSPPVAGETSRFKRRTASSLTFLNSPC
ncbi:hypothetical protein GALMADRAFT_1123233 [Galerina marginata CBS 339.88]|uniref:Uncharacterized protein n=1 Tax=Galerina marginata (strain CBS 339.88) TaxID=685588 RepID=A0A067TQA8_GALM3|nr:hypothetical protein GALMADRAFT_1123233 [Galerina marginata CBS 339.88]